MSLDAEALVRDIKVAYERWSSSEHNDDVVSAKNNNKSAVLAKEYMEKGDKSYRERKFSEASYFYSISVASAHNSKELCKAYGNRSAASYEKGKYGACLSDINRALKENCREAFARELRNRKVRCVEKLLGVFNVSDLNVKKDSTGPLLTGRVRTWYTYLRGKLDSSELPRPSSKIKFKYDEMWGRHFVAKENIKPGEPLIIEEDFVPVTSFSIETRFSYCDWCSMKYPALIPCPSCCIMMYCSELCRTKAYDSYHRTECILSFSFLHLSGKVGTAVRLFLIGTEQGAKLNNLMTELSVIDIFSANFDFPNEALDSDDYLLVLKLNNGVFDRHQAEVESFMENAVKIVCTLEKLNFFESVPLDRKEDAEVFATACLLNNYLGDYTYSATMGDGKTSWQSMVLFQHFFNHSCNANAHHLPVGRESIVYAVQPIKKDQQIFLSYIRGSFETTPKEERAKDLNFTCRCEACSENWPTYRVMESSSADDKQRIMMDDLKAYDKALGPNPALSKIVDIVTPLTDDTELMKLKIRELLTIIADVMTHLYEVMAPMSYACIELQRSFKSFLRLYFSSKEPYPVQNTILEFPRGSPYLYFIDKEEVKKKYPKQVVERYAIAFLYNFLCRLTYYTENVECGVYEIVQIS